MVGVCVCVRTKLCVCMREKIKPSKGDLILPLPLSTDLWVWVGNRSFVTSHLFFSSSPPPPAFFFSPLFALAMVAQNFQPLQSKGAVAAGRRQVLSTEKNDWTRLSRNAHILDENDRYLSAGLSIIGGTKKRKT